MYFSTSKNKFVGKFAMLVCLKWPNFRDEFILGSWKIFVLSYFMIFDWNPEKMHLEVLVHVMGILGGAIFSTLVVQISSFEHVVDCCRHYTDLLAIEIWIPIDLDPVGVLYLSISNKIAKKHIFE